MNNTNSSSVSSVQKEDYYNSLDCTDDESLEKILFTKENVQHFLLYQKSVELIGIVKETAIKSSLLKFDLINKSELTIQILVWDNEIVQKISKLIVSGNVIHIDGAFVKEKHITLSNSTIPFDLIISSNTKVRLIKNVPIYTSITNNPKEIPLTTIENSITHTGVIEIVAYIKQKIAETNLPKNLKINAGCITDCQKYKLEVRMPIVCDMSEFPVGSHVRIIGTIKFSTHPYLWVLKKEDIKIESNDAKKVFQLVKANTIPKRKLGEVTNKIPYKKANY